MLTRLILCALIGLGAVPTAHATIYWAATTGSASPTCANIDGDTDPGSYGTIKAAINCSSAGDTVYVKAGTYTGAGQGNLDFTTITPNGTSWTNAITVMSDPAGATAILANTDEAISMPPGSSKSYYIFKNLKFDSENFNTDDTIYITDPNHHIRFENIEMYNSYQGGIACFCADDDCAVAMEVLNSIFHDGGQRGAGYAIYNQCDGSLISGNEVYSWTGSGGIQAHAGTGTWKADNVTIRKNYIHDLSPGAITGNCGGIGLVDGAATYIYDNVVDLRSCTSGSVYGIQIGNSPAAHGTHFVYNNIVLGSRQGGIDICANAQPTSAEVKNNLIYPAAGSAIIKSACPAFSPTLSHNACPTADGTCGSNKLNLTAITDCMAGSTTFTHKAGSTCIGAGTSVSTRSPNGVTDIGPFESLGFSLASIDTFLMDVTLGMSLNTPVLPSSGITGFTVACSGSDCGTPVVASAVRLSGSDSVVRLTITGIGGTGNCAVGQTWTVSYSPGNATDSALIGNSLVQPLSAFTTQGVTEVCTGSGTTPPAGAYIDYALDENTGTTATDTGSAGINGTLTGGPTWVSGKAGGTDYAVAFADGVNDYIAIGYGSGVNPTTQSLTVCMGVLPSAGLTDQRIIFSSGFGTSQRMYIGWVGGTWGIGIQGNGFAAGSEFPVSNAWTRVCLKMDSGTSTATLYVNGAKGANAQSVKTYTSYTLVGNFRIGNDAAFAVNYSGSTVDSFILYQSALSDQDITDDYAAWNATAPAPTGTFDQKTHRFRKLRVDANGSAVALGATGAALSVVPGAAFALEFQVDCTTADCAPTSHRLRYSLNAGAYFDAPDTPGADLVAFYGDTTDTSVLTGALTCCLTGALTPVDGTTNFTSAAVPVVDLAQNSSVVHRYMIRLSTAVTAGSVYCFRLYNQDGNALNTYTTTPCITVVPMSIGVGF